MFLRKGLNLILLLVGLSTAQFDTCKINPLNLYHTCIYKGTIEFTGQAPTLNVLVPGITIVDSVTFQDVAFTNPQSTSILTAFPNLQSLNFDKNGSPTTIGFGQLTTNSYSTLRNLSITGGLSITIVENAFDRFVKLQNLTIRGSTISLAAMQLTNPTLENIDLQSNTGLKLPSNLFTQLINLKTLNISQSIITLQATQFTGLTNLLSLSMNYCGLSSIPTGAFDPLINMESLQLAGNNFATLSAFPRLPQLQHLHLNASKISTIDANAFSNLPKLQDLDLSKNPAIIYTDKIFTGLTFLSTLRLSNNELTKEILRPEILKQFVNLTQIDLSMNNIEVIHGALLGNNENLKIIDLTESKIKAIQLNFTSKLRAATVNLKLKKNVCVDLDFIVLNRDFERIQHDLVACHSAGYNIPKILILLLSVLKALRLF